MNHYVETYPTENVFIPFTLLVGCSIIGSKIGISASHATWKERSKMAAQCILPEQGTCSRKCELDRQFSHPEALSSNKGSYPSWIQEKRGVGNGKQSSYQRIFHWRTIDSFGISDRTWNPETSVHCVEVKYQTTVAEGLVNGITFLCFGVHAPIPWDYFGPKLWMRSFVFSSMSVVCRRCAWKWAYSFIWRHSVSTSQQRACYLLVVVLPFLIR